MNSSTTMILKQIAVGILTLVYLIDDGCANSNAHINPNKYPDFRKDDVYTYFDNDRVSDPFRWLEKVDSDETKKFIDIQRKLTDDYLQKSEYGEQIKDTYKELWKLEKYDGPFRKGGKYFSYRSYDADKQDILYMHNEPIQEDAEEFLNPNELDGSVTFHKATSAFSKDGKVFAYLTRESGSDSNTLQFKHIEKENIVPDKLTGVENSKVAWMKDEGVFYMSYVLVKDGTKTDRLKLYYHKLGTKQEEDISLGPRDLTPLQYHRFSISISDDDAYLIMTASQSTYDMVFVSNLQAINYKIEKELVLLRITLGIQAKYEYVTNHGSKFIFRTNEGADNFKLKTVDFTDILHSWKDLVPEDNKKVLHWAKPASNAYLVLSYIAEDITSVLQLHDSVKGSRIMIFELLDTGTVKAESFYYDEEKYDIYFKFESFFIPCIIYRFNLSTATSDFSPVKVKEITVPNFDPSQYKAKLVNFNSDGVDIPMYITSKKGMVQNRKNFTFMTANGGFSESLLPYFSVNRIVVVKHIDGLHVVANIRGGGEKGEDWHRQGSHLRKQNSMNDFQAAADYLIKEKYTSSELLAVDGGASGTSGPLMGASLNQRPDLFKVVIAEAGAMDMLRFDQYDGGRYLVSEYGSPRNGADSQYLNRYSPLHNVLINTTQYPATMLVTSAHDGRVPAQHSLKFIATLQSAAKDNPSIQENPLIIKIAESGKTSLEEAAEITMFIVMNTGIKFEP